MTQMLQWLTVDHVWLMVGFLGQALFASRFILQWFKSEQVGRRQCARLREILGAEIRHRHADRGGAANERTCDQHGFGNLLLACLRGLRLRHLLALRLRRDRVGDGY